MSRGEGAHRGEAEAASDEERYGALQTGYREALLVQLDLAITELEQQGDFTAEQIWAAVEIRLEKGPGALRSHRLAEEWDWTPRSR
ncbi:MAG: hypothetical protein M3131_08130 [Actinomycetota bacterium]|nr:hypothetical protein [Actinomycetota bacterium]